MPSDFDATSLRDLFCGDVRESHVGERLSVCGWVAKRREHGEHLAFLDVRDHTGVVQAVVEGSVDVRSEYVVRVTGTVTPRPEGTINERLATGAVELSDCQVEVLAVAEAPPFQLDERVEIDEAVRLRYRYLDLRREKMQQNLRLRAAVNAALRRAMDAQGFCEVETPLLWAPTPEGSREFVVPSRLQSGEFYVLPQSPQIAKQLLMVGGFDRYYQIARCLRDEDLRADRQFEFTQLDLEASFVTQDDVLRFVSLAVLDAAEAATGTRPGTIDQMTWAEALDRYGTDKPDLRFSMTLQDLSAAFAASEVRAFSAPVLKALRVEGGAAFSRARLDQLTEQAKSLGAKGLAWFRLTPEGLDSPLARFLSASEAVAISSVDGASVGDLVLVVADEYETACHVLGALRVAIGSPPVGEGPHRYLWVTEFPLFEGVNDDGPSARGPPPLHDAPSRGPRPPRDGAAARALPGLRPRPQRLGARQWFGSRAPSRYPVTRLSGARHQRRGGRKSLRLPARRLPVRGASPRWLRLWDRPSRRDLCGRGEHSRGDRLPKDPVGRRPHDRSAEEHHRATAARAAPARLAEGVATSLFDDAVNERLREAAPLAELLRPQTLDEIVGQDDLVGPDGPLRRLVEARQLTSMILWGPAGSGKTTLARILAHAADYVIESLSAVSSGVRDVREAIVRARARLGEHNQRTVLFIDEVHRFNKAQQDLLLPATETGEVVLIGATTENPYFEVNAALMSRSTLWRLHPLTESDLAILVGRGLELRGASITEDALRAVCASADGDARSALTTLDTAIVLARLGDDEVVDVAHVARARDGRLYHQSADTHYDQISAFIKSVRGSDPDAALYWMVTLLESGESARFLARRLVILASEDVGLADPTGLLVAESAARAVEFVGLPEARLTLAHATVFLSLLPKSNSVTRALGAATAAVQSGQLTEVPAHLRDS